MMLPGLRNLRSQGRSGGETVYVTHRDDAEDAAGKLARSGPNAIEADSLRDGLNQVIAEVRRGWCRRLAAGSSRCRSTGETAFVGFGSAVVRTARTRAVQAKLNLAAQKIAGCRAKDALCGLIIGDKSFVGGSVTESTKDEAQEFESATEGDPLAAKDPAVAKKLADRPSSPEWKCTDVYQSARNGILPPGVTSKTWFDEDHALWPTDVGLRPQRDQRRGQGRP